MKREISSESISKCGFWIAAEYIEQASLSISQIDESNLLRVRVALMTFTLGVAAVWMVNGFAIANRNVPVDLPSAIHGNVLLIFPIEQKRMPRDGGGGGGWRDECRGDERKRELCYR
ncbi:MAG: hypothetical protein DMF63_05365 [Acidobacteria bacterium]|nr:MAG: hypothetical protein DMF63_05365 [Acidobacteriota bacterium]